MRGMYMILSFVPPPLPTSPLGSLFYFFVYFCLIFSSSDGKMRIWCQTTPSTNTPSSSSSSSGGGNGFVLQNEIIQSSPVISLDYSPPYLLSNSNSSSSSFVAMGEREREEDEGEYRWEKFLCYF